MNVGVRFEQKPMGIGTLIESLVLVAAYVGLVLAMIVTIKGPTALDSAAPWSADVTSAAAAPAGH